MDNIPYFDPQRHLVLFVIVYSLHHVAVSLHSLAS